MVTLNLIDTNLIVQVITLVLAIAVSFLALRAQFLWFVACFCWAGVVVVWDNEAIQIISLFLAVISLGFFMAGHKTR